jgi:hypothetical protein
MAKYDGNKSSGDKRPGREDPVPADDRAQAMRMGVPEFLVRMAGRARLKALPSAEPIQHHCD